MRPRTPAILLAILLTLPAFAATRMTYDINGAPTAIEWAPTAFPLRYEVDQKLAQAHPSAVAMVDRAFGVWAAVTEATVRFEGRGVVERTSARHDDRIVVSLAGDLMSGQGAVALTAYTYDTNTGQMLDADIRVDPSLFDGQMNAQMALQHEVGHVLGLDHAAVLSSVMYPYVGSGGGVAQLDSDDVIAIGTMYPRRDPTLMGGTITGRVVGDGGGIFAAQVVAVNAGGQPVGTVLTNAAGEFMLIGIPDGRYRLYAEPLDGPVDVRALQGSWRKASSTPFPTQFFTSEMIVESGKVYGNVVISVSGPVQLNPRWIGACAPETSEISLSTSPVTVRPGQRFVLAVGGDGFTSGMTELEILNPAFRRVSEFEWFDNYMRATYVVEPDARAGSSVILVRSGLETAMLTGALRVHREPRTRSVRH